MARSSSFARAAQVGARQVMTSDSASELLGTAVGEAVKSLSRERRKRPGSISREDHNGGLLSGTRGVLVGAGAAALAPLAFKRAKKLVPRAALAQGAVKAPVKAIESATSKLGDSLSTGVGDKVSQKIDEAGGPSGILKDGVKSALPFGGGRKGEEDRKDGDEPGVGKGRRMPVQQSVDVAVPLKTAYNQWTQFEEWPQFMHRVTRVTQEDKCTVSFATKIWGKTKEFKAKIETQRPDERIKWRVAEGMSHVGVVSFHELGPRLTRIELELDLEPGGMLEKAARGMRHLKRAVRSDLHRFKAFVELRETETGAWRGVIEDGKVKSRASGSKSAAKRSGTRRSASSRSASSRAGATRSRATKSGATKSRSTKSSTTKSGSTASRRRQSGSANGSRSSANGSRSSSSRSRSASNGHQDRRRTAGSTRRS
jgi:uncharacterized membrane protein